VKNRHKSAAEVKTEHLLLVVSFTRKYVYQ